MKRSIIIGAVCMMVSCYVIGYVPREVAPIEIQIQSTESKSMMLTVVPFDEPIYLLGYQTFLANRNIRDAYFIAQAAVLQRPEDLAWRKRLAEVASWNNQPQVALQQWIYMAEQRKDLEAVTEAIKIASMLHDNQVLAKLFQLKIAMDTTDASAWKGYILAKENLGNPREVIEELKEKIKQDPKLFYFESLATMYQAIGEPTDELEVRNEITKRFGILSANALAQAKLLYSQGDLQGAHHLLLAAYPNIKPDDYQFLKALGEVSWLVQDKEHAQMAYEKLVAAGQFDQSSLVNLIQMIEAVNPSRAFSLALRGWSQFHSDFFLIKGMALGASLKAWKQLSEILNEITPEEEARLLQLPYYISVKAQLLMLQGNSIAALNLYHQALMNHPDALELKIDYLWFLIDAGYKKPLEEALTQWQGLLTQDLRLYPVFISGYVMIDRPQIALRLYQQEAEIQAQNPVWLMNVSGTLDQMGREKDAAKFRQSAWNRLLTTLKDKGGQGATKRDLINLARLSMSQTPGDFTANTMMQLTRYYSDQEAAVNLMAWAFQLDEYSLAEYLWYHRPANFTMPLWVEQRLALYHGDTDWMSELLEKNVNQLPYRDRVTAATLVGDEKLAQDLAYTGAEENPDDSAMYQLMTDIFLKSAGDVKINESFVNVGAIRGLRTEMSGKIIITPKISLSPWTNLWYTKTMKKKTILAARKMDEEFGLTMESRYSKAEVKMSAGRRFGLSPFTSGLVEGYYHFSSKINALLSLGYQQRATETTALLIAGMKNEAKLSGTYFINQYNSFNAETQAQYFQSQDQVYLGNGHVVSALYNHHFALTYPDWNTSFYVTRHVYQRTGQVSHRAASVMPSSAARQVSFFLPPNFIRYGTILGVGQVYQDSYTHAFRPFATIDFFNNNRFGFGGDANVGIASHLFGRDHLMLYYSWGVNVESADQSDYSVGLGYTYYC